MRYLFNDVLKHPSRLSEWWYELPLKRNIFKKSYWEYILFEPGQGWLTWKKDVRETHSDNWFQPPEPYVVLPPAKRVWYVIKYQGSWPLKMRDHDRKQHRGY